MVWGSLGRNNDPVTKIIKANYDVVAEVIKAHPKCAFGYKLGDKIIFTGREIKGKVCLLALQPLSYNFSCMYQTEDAQLKFEKTHCDRAITACPNARTPVIFESKMIDKKTGKPVPLSKLRRPELP